MERLSAEDRLMLWPDARWPQEIGALATLDGAGLFETDGRFRIEAVRRLIASRLHLVPRFRQVLCVPGRGLGGPFWTDDPAFDATYHITAVGVPAPADENAVLDIVEQLRSRRLDRAKPLWEMWFLTGLPDRRVGLFVRTHHAIADGIAGVATLGALLDPTDGTPAEPDPPWSAAPRPATPQLLADAVRRRAAATGSTIKALTRRPRAGRNGWVMWREGRRFLASPPSPRTSLDRPVGRGRRVATVRADLDTVARAAHRHDATINDVLLVVTTAGLRDLLTARRDPAAGRPIPVYVPVTLRRPADRAAATGNAIGQTVVPLPVNEPDPVRRLRKITSETAKLKTAGHADLGAMFRSPLARAALLAFLRRHPVSVTTADIPGPTRPLHLAGSQLLDVFPLLPLIGNVTLAVGALSYAGQLNITVIADRDSLPDLHAFIGALRRELDALCRTATSA